MSDIKSSLKKLKQSFDLQQSELVIVVDPSEQKLYLTKNQEVIKRYPVSTSKNGLGNKVGSMKTPWGTHRIKEKIGDGVKVGTIFKARKNTGKISTMHTDKIKASEDFITTRIMWLEGQEEGVNKGEEVDSYRRFIYIHGTPEEGFIGEPASHGCIRMKNRDIVELFDLVPLGTLVEIQNKSY